MRSNGSTFLRQVGLIAGKDLKVFILDRWTLLFAVAFPFMFVIVFSLVMGGAYATSDEKLVVYLATEEQQGSLSQSIIDATVASAEGLDARQADAESAREAFEREDIGGYLLFPLGFSEAVFSGKPASIIVNTNPDRSTTRVALLSIGRSIAAEIQSHLVLAQAVAALGTGPGSAGGSGVPSGPAPDATSGPASGSMTSVGVNLVFDQVGEIEQPRPVDLLIPGYLTMFVFFALALSAETIAMERENRTLERMVAGTASRMSIIGGKVAGFFARGLVQVTIFWVAGTLIFSVRMGTYPWAVVLVSILLTLAAAGVGIFMAAMAKSRKAAASMALFVSLSAAVLGGSWWPLFIMPSWLQNLAKITPHAWANVAFNKLMIFGATPANVVPEMVALLVFAVVFFGLGVWRFRLD